MKSTKKTAVKKTSTLDFQPGSYREKAYLFLKDGKVRSAEEIVKGVGGKKSLKERTPAAFIGPIIAQFEAAGIKVLRPQAGSYQLKPSKGAAA